MAADGPHWRRVVPAPEHVRLVEQESIEQLVSGGTAVVCAGGEGAPVVDSGQLHGVEAVVDKDLTSAELAIAFKADRLLLLTDVRAVMTDFGTPDAEPLQRLDLAEVEGADVPCGVPELRTYALSCHGRLCRSDGMIVGLALRLLYLILLKLGGRLVLLGRPSAVKDVESLSPDGDHLRLGTRHRQPCRDVQRPAARRAHPWLGTREQARDVAYGYALAADALWPMCRCDRTETTVSS